jgi:hypothetical protein
MKVENQQFQLISLLKILNDRWKFLDNLSILGKVLKSKYGNDKYTNKK